MRDRLRASATDALFMAMPAPALVVDAAGVVLQANAAAARLLNTELVGRPLRDHVVESDRELLDVHWQRALAEQTPHSRELQLTTRDGAVADVSLQSVFVEDLHRSGRHVWLTTIQDLASQKRRESKLRESLEQLRGVNRKLVELAHVDPLTSLSNRRAMEAVLRSEVARVDRNGSTLLAVLLDCDNFKQVNDSFGHSTGDQVLVKVARRIKRSVRPADHLGRIGGDEFLLLLPDTEYAEGLRVADRVRTSVAESAVLRAPWPVTITLSLGVARLPPRVSSLQEVIGLTERALKHSKVTGKNRVTAEHAALPQTRRFEGAVRALPVIQRGRGAVAGDGA